MKNESSCFTGYLFAFSATALWSVNFIIARSLSVEMPPLSISFYRWSIATVAFLPISIQALRKDFSILKKHLLYISVTSFLGISLFNTLIYIAGHSTSAINMSMIAIMSPVFIVVFLRVFLKEKISVKKILGIIVVFSGAIYLLSKGEPAMILSLKPALGDLWMLLAAMVFAAYSILVKHRPRELRLIPFQQSLVTIGTLFLLPFFVVERIKAEPQLFSSGLILALLYAGVFASLAAFLLWNKAISQIGPVRAGMIYYVLPLLSTALAALTLGEEIKFYHFICMVLIIGGILLTTYEKAPE